MWDKFLSLVHTEYPTSVDCDKAQDYIDEIVKLADSMGMSRSIKIHVCCKNHLVLQMRRFECGLSDFDENFMEQYHQAGAKLDNKHISVSADRQADTRSSRLRRSENTQSQAAIGKVSELFSRKRHGNHEVNEKLKILKMTEKREQQLHQIRNSEQAIPRNSSSLNTADDEAASPPNVPHPDDGTDGTTGAILWLHVCLEVDCCILQYIK